MPYCRGTGSSALPKPKRLEDNPNDQLAETQLIGKAPPNRHPPVKTIVGVAWYREHDWPRIKTLFQDGGQLHDSHAEWLKDTRKAMKQLEKEGCFAKPVVIDIDDLIGWCLVRGCKIDAKARTEYVVHLMQAESKG
jgi:hypothetical protein